MNRLTIVSLVDYSLSTSFEADDTTPFHIGYSDDSSYDGQLFADTLRIGETAVENATMALVDSSQNLVENAGPVGNGIWGINFPIGQANIQRADDTPYESIVQKMKKGGAIKSVSYSLWLDSLGTLLLSLFPGLSLFAAADSLCHRREKRHHSLRWSRLCQIYSPADWCSNHQKPHERCLRAHVCRIHLSLSQ